MRTWSSLPLVLCLSGRLLATAAPAAAGGARDAVTSGAAPSGPAARVVEIAREFARQRGYTVDDYAAKAVKVGAEWEVVFRPSAGRKPSPGDFFTVYVDANTLAATRLVPGK
jgi:hypothetical protein